MSDTVIRAEGVGKKFIIGHMGKPTGRFVPAPPPRPGASTG